MFFRLENDPLYTQIKIINHTFDITQACTLHVWSLCHTLACAGGDCIGLLSRTMCCSCLSFLYAAGISVILLQEKSSRMRGRSASSAGTHERSLLKTNKTIGEEPLFHRTAGLVWECWNSMQHHPWDEMEIIVLQSLQNPECGTHWNVNHTADLKWINIGLWLSGIYVKSGTMNE